MRAAALTIVAVLAFAGCGTGSGSQASDRLQVVTTVSPLTSMVANIAGPDAVVSGLVPEGANSHTFDPPPSAARLLSRADLIFVNGLKLEDPVADLARVSKRDGTPIVSLGDRTLPRAQYIYDFSFPRAGGRPNPHLWTSPVRARKYAEEIRDALIAADPEHRAGYQLRFARYATRLDALDRALRQASATVTPARRRLLTYHDAYAYFAVDYGWTVEGAIQVSDFSDPSPREVAALIEQVRRLRVPAIFGSEVFPSPVLEQIGREAGVRYVDELRDDDLPGRPGDPDHTYLALMQFDYVTIIEAMGGDPAALRSVDVTDIANDEARYPQ